jgi:hypothetical protein
MPSHVRIDLTELVLGIEVDAKFEEQEKGKRVIVVPESDLLWHAQQNYETSQRRDSRDQ